MSAKESRRKGASGAPAKLPIPARTKSVPAEQARSKPSRESASVPVSREVDGVAYRLDAFQIPTSDEFFAQYSLSPSELAECGLTWAELSAIASDHLTRVDSLHYTANYIAERLRAIEAVHSVNVRVKDPSHLLEKIVRKRREDPSRQITIDNYRSEISDLIGIRALHLFKVEWLAIHEFIKNNWPLVETPIANIRRGDPEAVSKLFCEQGCEIREHPAGYRSAHYLIESKPAKDVVIAEVQVRTIFEEGWSQIDHRVRYPYAMNNGVLNELLEVFNRLAGGADEMGSFVQSLSDDLHARDRDAVEAKAAYEETVRGLREEISKLKIDSKAKEQLEQRVRELESRSVASPNLRLANDTLAGVSGASYPYANYLPSTLGVYLSASSAGYYNYDRSLIASNLGLTVNKKCKTCGAEISPFGSISSDECTTCYFRKTYLIR